MFSTLSTSVPAAESLVTKLLDSVEFTRDVSFTNLDYANKHAPEYEV